MATSQDVSATLWRNDAGTLAGLIRDREVSAREVLDAHLDRIAEVEPSVNALAIPLFEGARVAAAAADESLAAGDDIGPLHGVPISIKEQFRVVGTQTTLGASRFIGHIARDEGPLVRALRDAGAVILGKTNIMQTLAGWETDNPVYGRTDNPWNLDRTPGGSSGGEAALIAAGGSALGLAGDLGGSIRVPAHFCGLAGLKPTSHRLSNDDFMPGLLGSGQEVFIAQPGPLARSVADVSLAMRTLTSTSLQPTADLAPPVPWVDPATIDAGRLRVGFYTTNSYFDAANSVRRVVTEAAQALDRHGVDVQEIPPPDVHEGVRIFLGAASAAGSSDLFDLLGGEKPIPQLAGVMNGARIPGPLRRLVASRMASRGQRYVAGLIESMKACSAGEYFDIVEARNRYVASFQAMLDRHGVDVVICPPVALPAFTHGASEHLLPAVADSMIYNVLGAPAGVVPLSRVTAADDVVVRPTGDRTHVTATEVERNSVGLPLGVQVVARHWDDHKVLAMMGLLEELFADDPNRPSLDALPM